MGFVPALKYHFLTPIYDKFLSFWLPEKSIRLKTTGIAKVNGNEKVLDFGCGTGTLLLQLADQFPNLALYGVDIDPKILKIAKSKDANNRINWQLLSHFEAFENSFDTIFCTWVFHHFSDSEKAVYLEKLNGYLKRGGTLIVVDWGKPSNALMQVLFFIVQCFDSFKTMKMHRKGQFSSLFSLTGFHDWKEVFRQDTWFGTLKYWELKKS